MYSWWSYGDWESFEQTAIRETFEETGLEIDDLKLFGIYSGESCFVQYPNGDKAYSVQVIFTTTTYSGVLKLKGIESREHRFFRRDNLPENLNHVKSNLSSIGRKEKRYL